MQRERASNQFENGNNSIKKSDFGEHFGHSAGCDMSRGYLATRELLIAALFNTFLPNITRTGTTSSMNTGFLPPDQLRFSADWKAPRGDSWGDSSSPCTITPQRLDRSLSRKIRSLDLSQRPQESFHEYEKDYKHAT